MVLWVHLLRAAAALAVMSLMRINLRFLMGIGDYVPDFPMGAAGVDLFFVISGFVMVVASADLFGQRGAPPYFFLRRLARIVPLYWLLTGIFVFILFAGRHHSSSWLSASEVVTSLLFIPHSLPNGAVAPVYGLGWTLNYEMMFYVVFSAVLFLRPRIAIPTLALAMLWLAYIVPRYSLGADQLLGKSDHRGICVWHDHRACEARRLSHAELARRGLGCSGALLVRGQCGDILARVQSGIVLGSACRRHDRGRRTV